jgi:hypothetical protein
MWNSMSHLSPLFSPIYARSSDLNACGLRLSDLPMQDPTRDIVLMGEHLYSEIQSAYQLDKANKALNEGMALLRGAAAG